MPEVRHIAISIKPISNGVIGSITVHHSDYEQSTTDETYFATLVDALDELVTVARDPDKIIAERPTSPDHPF